MSKMKSLLAAAIVVAVFGAAASNAQAYDLTFSPGGAVSANGTLSWSDTGGLLNMSCPYTLSGTVPTAAVADAPGASLAAIRRVTVGGCAGGVSWTALNGSTWRITFEGYVGTAPGALTGIRVKIRGWNGGFSGSIFGVPQNCLWQGDLAGVIALSGSNPYAVGAFTSDGDLIPFSSGDAVCPSDGRWNGSLAISPAQSLTVS